MEFYLMKLKKLEETYLESLEFLFYQMFEKEYNNENIHQLDKKELGEFYKKATNLINEQNSTFTLQQIKDILLVGEVGHGASLQAFRSYICKSCHKEELWHNYSIPHFCDSCREQMARNIINSKIIENILIKNKEQ